MKKGRNKMNIKTLNFALIFMGIFGLSFSLKAGGPSGYEIMKKANEKANFGVKNGSASLTMVLLNKRGKKKVRKLSVVSSNQGEGKNKSLARFLTPSDVKGVGFLSVDQDKEVTNQYLYLPAFKKVKRILGNQKSQSFMGSDFSYGDLESRDVNDFNYEKKPDQKLGKNPCFVVISKPKKMDDDEQYSKTKTWVSKSNFVPLKVEFYDKKNGKLKKVLLAHKVSKDNGKWVIKQSSMTNIKKKHKTLLKVEDINWNKKVNPSTFTKENLKKY